MSNPNVCVSPACHVDSCHPQVAPVAVPAIPAAPAQAPVKKVPYKPNTTDDNRRQLSYFFDLNGMITIYDLNSNTTAEQFDRCNPFAHDDHKAFMNVYIAATQPQRDAMKAQTKANLNRLSDVVTAANYAEDMAALQQYHVAVEKLMVAKGCDTSSIPKPKLHNTRIIPVAWV